MSICWVASLLERVLELLAGLLDVALHLVGLTLGPQLVVAADLADGLLQLSLCLLGSVLCLVGRCHVCSLSWDVRRRKSHLLADFTRVPPFSLRGDVCLPPPSRDSSRRVSL